MALPRFAGVYLWPIGRMRTSEIFKVLSILGLIHRLEYLFGAANHSAPAVVSDRLSLPLTPFRVSTHANKDTLKRSRLLIKIDKAFL